MVYTIRHGYTFYFLEMTSQVCNLNPDILTVWLSHRFTVWLLKQTSGATQSLGLYDMQSELARMAPSTAVIASGMAPILYNPGHWRTQSLQTVLRIS